MPIYHICLGLALATVACTPLPQYVLARYGTYRSADNRSRDREHAGVDFKAPLGSRVLAAAPGRVVAVWVGRQTKYGCGNGVYIRHGANAFTQYCHMDEVSVGPGVLVARGQQIGTIGMTGGTPLPHVHLELCTSPCPGGHIDGSLKGTVDPLKYSVGCFAGPEATAKNSLILTYPIACKGQRVLVAGLPLVADSKVAVARVADVQRAFRPPAAWRLVARVDHDNDRWSGAVFSFCFEETESEAKARVMAYAVKNKWRPGRRWLLLGSPGVPGLPANFGPYSVVITVTPGNLAGQCDASSGQVQTDWYFSTRPRS